MDEATRLLLAKKRSMQIDQLRLTYLVLGHVLETQKAIHQSQGLPVETLDGVAATVALAVEKLELLEKLELEDLGLGDLLADERPDAPPEGGG